MCSLAGLLEALAKFVEEKHAHEISQHNAELSITLLNEALSQRAQRQHQALEAHLGAGADAEPEPEAEGAGGGPLDLEAMPILKADFGIGNQHGSKLHGGSVQFVSTHFCLSFFAYALKDVLFTAQAV